MDSDTEGEIFEVDYIMDQRGRGRTLEYFVRWKGFGDEEDSWEPARNLKDAKAAVDEFLKGNTPLKTPAKRTTIVKKQSTTGSKRQQKSDSTTTKRSVTSYTVSDASSPESSPVLSRKTITSTKRVEVTQTRSGSRSAPRRQSLSERLPAIRVPRFVQQACREMPIVIMLTSMVFLALTFVFEKQLNKLLK